MPITGWVGFDFDGTLAYYEHGASLFGLGQPIPAMLQLAKELIAAKVEIRIVTARAREFDQIEPLRRWCLEHLGTIVPITDKKDYRMVVLFDDRAATVATNEGLILGLPTTPGGPIRDLINNYIRRAQ